MLTFLDGSHKFTVDNRASNLQLEFTDSTVYCTLVRGANFKRYDAVPADQRDFLLVVPHALYFQAECIVLIPKETSPRFRTEFQLLEDYEFGFVQAVKLSDIHLEYWGQIPANGRAFQMIRMPDVFELDTSIDNIPWIYKNFSIVKNLTQAASKFNSLKISSRFTDHPLLSFPHTIKHKKKKTEPPLFIRSIFYKEEFRTIFCFQNKKDGSFTPISSTEWVIHCNQIVNYSVNGATKTPFIKSNSSQFPRGGNPANLNATDRQIMAMAKAGSPALTHEILEARVWVKETTYEDSNPDFDASFWT
ncbi:MAG: hypothetical protein WCK96_16720 [Methylococcales bacterium]